MKKPTHFTRFIRLILCKMFKDMGVYSTKEKLIKEACTSSDPVLRSAYKKMFRHFKLVDTIEHTMHCSAITMLYAQQNVKRTLPRIAKLNFIDTKRLTKNRKLYISYFEYFCKYPNEDSAESEAAATTDKKSGD